MSSQKDVQDLLRLFTGKLKAPLLTSMGWVKALQGAGLSKYAITKGAHVNGEKFRLNIDHFVSQLRGSCKVRY